MIIKWKPDRKDKRPIYMQIVGFVEDKVSNGEWPIGTLLPSQRRLSEIFNVNRSTVVSAMDELRSKSIIAGKGKSGTRIINQHIESNLGTPHNWQSYIDQSR